MTTKLADTLQFRLISAEDIEAAFRLESQGYPKEEAASLAQLQFRYKAAGDLFLGAYLTHASLQYLPPSQRNEFRDAQLVGYTVATRTSSPTLTHSSMSEHEPQGRTVCIHSVCVDPRLRRMGIAKRCLLEFIRNCKDADRVSLISHRELLGLYEAVGFKCIGESSVVHGPEKWYECVLEVRE
ncbi:uncharacterized protein VTP21DRAFT_7975 [Calcarisporiella thermophila]|uniref:uncharacterized protein n=1 Tax=Calcarisporiella thermophila TaxID=911321 RepID=UPI003743DCD9